MLSAGAFDGRVVIVTGGASGIGRAAAVSFAQLGAAVVIADMQEAEGRDAEQQILGDGGRAAFVATDVTNEAQVDRMVEFAVERFGGLHCAFNNAGITGPPAPFHQTELDTWRRVIEVDMTSVFLCMRAEIRHMLQHGGGAIVNTSSQTSVSPAPNLVSYAAAKKGVIGLTLSGAVEYADNGIRVNAILPGATATPMIQKFREQHGGSAKIRTDIGNYASPDRVAAAAVWLCSDDASWISGESLLVDRGKALHLSSGSPPPFLTDAE